MLPIARQNKIKDLLLFKKSVTVAELAKLYNVTEETIRRDLQAIENEGFLTRTYGGAYISEGISSTNSLNLQENSHSEGKERIAEHCTRLINDGDSIFLDASTTSLFVAQKIKDKALTIVTNSVKILTLLTGNENINLVMVGGNLNRSSMSFLGNVAESCINGYFFDKAVISCRCLSANHGVMDSDEQQSQIRKIAVEHANSNILVADHTKFNRVAFANICSFDKIDTAVTDEYVSDEWAELFQQNNIDYIEAV